MFKRSLKCCFSSAKFSQNHVVKYRAKDFFEVVSNVSDYKNFLPWCSESVITQKRTEDNFDARLTINFKIYKASYISTVDILKTPGTYQIESNIEPNNPIFNFLISKWHIKELGENNCQMKYDVEFEFRNFLYQHVSNLFIDFVGEKMTKAFEKRLFEKNLEKTRKETNFKEINVAETKRKTTLIIANPDIIESLKVQIGKFYKLQRITHREFMNLMEIIEKNADLKEFLIQAYILFCNNLNCKDGEYKLLSYLKDISLMKKMRISN